MIQYLFYLECFINVLSLMVQTQQLFYLSLHNNFLPGYTESLQNNKVKPINSLESSEVIYIQNETDFFWIDEL